MYKQIKNQNGDVVNIVSRQLDGACIPFDPANTDYQKYLEWVAEGNLPSPADIVEPSQASVTPLPADE
jgi:hypothetical protein